MWARLLYKELSLEGNIKIAESCPFPLKYLKYDNKRGRSKRQKCNDGHFAIIRFFQNLITSPTDVFKSCNLSECCFYSFKHSKRYNRAKTKTFHLPGNRSLKVFKKIHFKTSNNYGVLFSDDVLEIWWPYIGL